MKIVFMGTPDYAVATLEKIIESGHEVAAVFAQPDKPVGRKQILTPPPVKVTALENNIPIFQPATLKDPQVLSLLKQIQPDVIVVVAYGKLLPEEILASARLGCVNGHASLLPKYRGASPIQWCIVCGETKTGVTTMLMDKGMDTGDILEQREVEIVQNETAEQLFERLAQLSADLMVSTLSKLEKGEITPTKQEGEPSYAPIIKKEMALLDFSKTAHQLACEVRGYYSWPCSYFFIDGKRIKVITAREGGKTDAECGSVIGNTDELVIACASGSSLRILELQPEGSRPMTAKQLLCGKNIPLGTVVNNG